MDPVIEIKKLYVDYGKKEALRGLDLTVMRGEIFGFLGPNGAGKSTTLKTILGLIFPKAGTVRLHGLSADNPKARASVGYLPEETTYYRFLNPREILFFYGTLAGVSREVLKKRIPELLDTVGLSDVASVRLSTFSKGMMQKVGLAQALVNDPETLILDEPTSGLDPLARLKLRELLRDLKAKGKTIFFSSHELSEVELLCDTVAILKDGALVSAGPIGEVLKRSHEESLERFFIRTIEGGAR